MVLKTAVAAPMPRPSVRIETKANALRSPQHARAVAQVADEVFEKRRSKLIACLFFHVLHSSKLNEGLTPCFGRIQTTPDVLLGLLIDMKTNLLAQPGLDITTPHDRAEPTPTLNETFHAVPCYTCALLRLCPAPCAHALCPMPFPAPG